MIQEFDPGTLDEPPPGHGDEVHLWRVRLQEAGWSARVRQSLSEAELERAERFQRDRDRRRYELRTAFLREVLGRYTSRDPAALVLCPSPRGKPFLAGPEGSDLRFNPSHSGDLVYLAVAWGREVGVDVETGAAAGELEPERLAAVVFDAREREALGRLPPARRREAFLRGWTRKEAGLKALGEGFLRDPREVHVGVEEAPLEVPREIEDPLLAPFGTLADLEAPEGVAAALCVEGRGWRLRRA